MTRRPSSRAAIRSIARPTIAVALSCRPSVGSGLNECEPVHSKPIIFWPAHELAALLQRAADGRHRLLARCRSGRSWAVPTARSSSRRPPRRTVRARGTSSALMAKNATLVGHGATGRGARPAASCDRLTTNVARPTKCGRAAAPDHRGTGAVPCRSCFEHHLQQRVRDASAPARRGISCCSPRPAR